MSDSRWDRFKQSVSSLARTRPARYFFSCVSGISAGSGVYAASTVCVPHPCGCAVSAAACAVVSVVKNRELRRTDEMAEAAESQGRELALLKEQTRDGVDGLTSQVERQHEFLHFMTQRMEDTEDKQQYKKILMTPAEERAIRHQTEAKLNPFGFFNGQPNPAVTAADVYANQKEALDQSTLATRLMDELAQSTIAESANEKSHLNPGVKRSYI